MARTRRIRIRAIFELGVPVLGICYGDAAHGASPRRQGRAQRAARVRQRPAPAHRARARSSTASASCSISGIRTATRSRNCRAASAPSRKTDNSPVRRDRAAEEALLRPAISPRSRPHAARQGDPRRISSTEICGCKMDWTMGSFIEQDVRGIRAQVGSDHVHPRPLRRRRFQRRRRAAAQGDRRLSSPASSSTTACSARTKPRRCSASSATTSTSSSSTWTPPRASSTSSSGVTDPERKRKIIGNEFIRVFDDAVPLAHAAKNRPASSAGSPKARSTPT